MNKVWKKWLKITKRIVDFQIGLVLTVSFLFFIIPASLIINNLKFHKVNPGEKKSYWLKKQSIKNNLMNAYKQ